MLIFEVAQDFGVLLCFYLGLFTFIKSDMFSSVNGVIRLVFMCVCVFFFN